MSPNLHFLLVLSVGALAASVFWIRREARLRRHHTAQVEKYRCLLTQMLSHHVEFRGGRSGPEVRTSGGAATNKDTCDGE